MNWDWVMNEETKEFDDDPYWKLEEEKNQNVSILSNPTMFVIKPFIRPT